jgi:hypothetical protein
MDIEVRGLIASVGDKIKKQEEAFNEETGIKPSLRTEEMEHYLKEVLTEISTLK